MQRTGRVGKTSRLPSAVSGAREARLAGVTPFCVTIDRDSEAELKDLYGEVGYTIIDDVLSLPERMPAIYRRLTT
jgi:nitric oxide reductase NorD protein